LPGREKEEEMALSMKRMVSVLAVMTVVAAMMAASVVAPGVAWASDFLSEYCKAQADLGGVSQGGCVSHYLGTPSQANFADLCKDPTFVEKVERSTGIVIENHGQCMRAVDNL